MSKRIFLFIAVNLVIVISVSFITSFLGLGPALSQYGVNYKSLAVLCLVWGFSGSLISLALSRVLAKKFMRVEVISPNTRIPELQNLVSAVHRLSRQAGLNKMPEVGIYPSDEINAFATGPTKNRALVAISSGLANRMDANQIYGVLGHEIAHIANGDMVTLTLIQGVVNSFVMFFARVASIAVARNMRQDSSRVIRYFLTIAFEIVFGIVGSVIVCWFSRFREYRADEGGAKIAGRENMIAALEGLAEQSYLTNNSAEESGLASLKIYGKNGRIMGLFSTHPPLQDRIDRLKNF